MGVKSTFYNQASVLHVYDQGNLRCERADPYGSALNPGALVAYFGAKVDTHSYQAIPAQNDCNESKVSKTDIL